MDGSNDFRPEAAHRASDPSIEEMLRRARDAPLDDTVGAPHRQAPHLTPFSAMSSARVRTGILPGRIVFLAGVLVGVLMVYMVVRAGVLISSAVTPAQPVAQPASTATTFVSPTATPLPTPTDVPTAPVAPTADEIVALAQQFYDNLTPFAGTYVFVDATAAEVESQNATQLTACIVYEYAATASPDTIIGTDTRLFTLILASDCSWQVMGMGSSGSCSLD